MTSVKQVQVTSTAEPERQGSAFAAVRPSGKCGFVGGDHQVGTVVGFKFGQRWPMWVLTVPMLRWSFSAISWFDRPWPTRVRTSRSRVVRRSSSRGVDCRAGRRMNSAMSRRVVVGASRASPAATTRMAVSSSVAVASLPRDLQRAVEDGRNH